jgi:hypothetical protein
MQASWSRAPLERGGDLEIPLINGKLWIDDLTPVMYIHHIYFITHITLAMGCHK